MPLSGISQTEEAGEVVGLTERARSFYAGTKRPANPIISHHFHDPPRFLSLRTEFAGLFPGSRVQTGYQFVAGVDGVAFFADNPDRAGAEMMDEVRGVVRCPVGGACATQVIGSDSGNSCNEGYKGPLCNLCSPRFTRLTGSGDAADVIVYVAITD